MKTILKITAAAAVLAVLAGCANSPYGFSADRWCAEEPLCEIND